MIFSYVKPEIAGVVGQGERVRPSKRNNFYQSRRPVSAEQPPERERLIWEMYKES